MTTLLEFLNHVLPESPNRGFVSWIAIQNKIVKQAFCKTNEELAQILRGVDSRRWDAYFACSAYKEPVKRTQENVSKVKSIWLDVDAGKGKPYPDAAAAEADVLRFCGKTGLPIPTMVCSGNGLHVYWVLETWMEPEPWKTLAQGLKALTAKHGLKADPARTADSASILRPPSTYNWKNPVEPKDVYVLGNLQNPVPNDFLIQKISIFGIAPLQTSAPSNSLAQSIVAGIAESRPVYEPSFANVAVSKCKQLANLRDTSGLVPEPLWYANLGVLAHCQDGELYAQAWSSGHPDYTETETTQKLTQARNAAGPTTCARFKDLNPEGCKGCPHIVTSPVQLGINENIPVPPFIGDEPEDKKPWLPDGFAWGPNMQVMARILDPDAEPGEKKYIYQAVSHNPFYVSSIRQEETTGVASSISAQITSRTPHEPWRSFVVKIDDLKGAGWESCLAKYGILASPGYEKPFKHYVLKSIIGKQQMARYDISYNCFGWKNDKTSFLVGRKLYARHGPPLEVSGTGEVERASDLLTSRGSFQEWRKIANKLFAPGCEAQAFGLLCSFASPFMPFLFGEDEGGTIVSFVSYSGGKGKTSTLAAIESVWGATGCLRLTNADTVNAKFKALGVRCNLPVVLDEWNDMDPNIASEFASRYTGGTDKRRLNRNAEDVGSPLKWQNILIVGTNQPIVDQMKDAHSPAQSDRIFEVPVVIPPHLVGAHSALLSKEFQRHHGFAGPAFIIHVMNTVDLAHLEDKLQKLTDSYAKILKLPNEYRFMTRLMAAVTVAANILATPMGPGQEPMLEFDPKRLIKWALEVINERAKSFSREVPADEILSNFCRKYQSNWLIMDGPHNPNKPSMVITEPRGELMGRYEKSSGKLYIPRDALHKFTVAARAGFTEVARILEQRGVLLNRNRMTTLTAGALHLPSLRTSCWEIDLTHPSAGEISILVNTEEANRVNEAIRNKKNIKN